MKNNKIIKEVTKNLKENALEMERMMRFVDAFRNIGFHMFDRSSDGLGKEFQEGLTKIRNAINGKYCQNMVNCFMWVGADDDIKDLALEKLEERFDEKNRYIVMDFLEKYGNLPHTWKTKDENDLREEVKEKIKEQK